MTDVRADSDVVQRLTANMREQKKDVGDAVVARRVAEYTDPVRYRNEVEALFHALPIVVAHSSQLPGPGDFITHESLGKPLIVTRDQTGLVRAFLNVCRHRSAVVETAARGNRSSFICPYHHWRYGLDGTLANIPDQRSFTGVNTAELGLHPVKAAEKHGLIFVRLSDGPPIDIDEYLGDVGVELDRLHLSAHRFYHERLTPLQCNWKVMMEGSLETYHFNFLHAATAGGHFASMFNTHDNFGVHQRFVMAARRLLEHVEQGRDVRQSILPNYYIFPNTVLTFPHDHMTLTQVFPKNVRNCVFYNSLLTLPTATGPRTDDYWERALTLTESVNNEDFAIVQGIQKNYDLAPDEHVIHGRYEHGISYFHAACERVLTAWRARHP